MARPSHRHIRHGHYFVRVLRTFVAMHSVGKERVAFFYFLWAVIVT